MERGLVVGLLMFIVGFIVALIQVLRWSDLGFGNLDTGQTVRIAIPAALGLMLGFLMIMFSMFAGILTIPTRGESFAPARRTEADAELVPHSTG